MTSSRKLITSKPWFSSSAVPIILFVLLFLQGAFLGLSDDEAYYWVLAQRPAWAYAFHPPAMGWFVAVSRFCFGGIFGSNSSEVVRLPAALSMAVVFGLAMSWFEDLGFEFRRSALGILILMSFAGLFSLCWMMVPDTPLFLGWMIMMVCCWRICTDSHAARANWIFLTCGAALTLLSKYSGILAIGSCFLSLLLLAPKQRKISGIICIVLGSTLAAVPVLIWNSQHHWASILFQLQSRHEGGGLSFKRYLRFWAIEIFAAGPFLFHLIWMLRNWRKSRVTQFLLIWVIPAFLVFCLQPLWSDFKPHWAFIVWWPIALCFAAKEGEGKISNLAKIQIVYGLFLGAVVMISCHQPILSRGYRFFSHQLLEPKMDVTNDFYGWAELPRFLRSLGSQNQGLPVIGSRYQTASQAAVSLDNSSDVTLIPRDEKALDEWPVTDAVDSQGPEWPDLKKPVLFVTDNRYDAKPEFKRAHCRVLGHYKKMRQGFLAKTIQVERCDPEP